jgi:hypothetical protein
MAFLIRQRHQALWQSGDMVLSLGRDRRYGIQVIIKPANAGRHNASSASGRATNKLSAYLPAFAPNHFVCGLFAREAQDKLIGHFKIMRRADAHAAVGPIHHETIVRCCGRFGHDDCNVPERPTQRATSICKCLPDHGCHQLFWRSTAGPFSSQYLSP